MYSDDTTKEIAKAVQEIAKTGGTALELAGKTGAFISKIIGKPTEEIGGILGETISYYRQRNLLAIEEKLNRIRKKYGGDEPSKIHPRLALPILEAASLEDNETLQEVWARLIANSTNPLNSIPLHPGFIEVVKQLLPDEAVILKTFCRSKTFPILFSHHANAEYELPAFYYRPPSFGGETLEQRERTYQNLFGLYTQFCNGLVLSHPKSLQIYLDNMIRLRLLELGYDFSGTSAPEHSAFASLNMDKMLIPARDEYLKITKFGEEFLGACIASD